MNANEDALYHDVMELQNKINGDISELTKGTFEEALNLKNNIINEYNGEFGSQWRGKVPAMLQKMSKFIELRNNLETSSSGILSGMFDKWCEHLQLIKETVLHHLEENVKKVTLEPSDFSSPPGSSEGKKRKRSPDSTLGSHKSIRRGRSSTRKDIPHVTFQDEVEDNEEYSAMAPTRGRKNIKKGHAQSDTVAKPPPVTKYGPTISEINEEDIEPDDVYYSLWDNAAWYQLNYIPDQDKIPEMPAVYQIKVRNAKKCAYIGTSDNLRTTLMNIKEGGSSGLKILDKFIERNREDIVIQCTVSSSLNVAKIKQANQLAVFRKNFMKNPPYNN